MILEGQFDLPAPIQQAWEILLNPEVLATCVPGCEKLDVIDDKTYSCIVGAKVGSISARFNFTAKITETDPPKHLKAAGSGEEMSKLATFSMEMAMDLKELSANEVQVSYRANVAIVGKLATFGDRIMKAKAKQVQEELTKALKQRLMSESVEAAVPAATDEKPAAPAAKDEEPAALAVKDEEPTAAAASDEAATEAEAAAPADKAPAEKTAAKKASTAKAQAAKAPAAKKAATGKALATRAPAGTSKAIKGTPAIKVTFWEMITVFFVVLWEKITGLFKGNRK